MSGAPTVPTGYSSSTDLILSYGPAFPWQVFALACALLFLAFLFRRLPWARWALTGAAVLALIVAGVLWAGMA
ncbi:hypothetical protein GCM10008959_03990 [Deinococcus seoulensis]|uniref:Uncharacterized protein n=1 Tax=Deinococcus seoulensis TaxID=1837379 RepID=A0ABQ2RL51_9DEIO|nr:hypothetical protein [Deinococcus seoulensis]GGR46191.1 hypothetical protein GCM10008959_03990 [Deinococcus seoulensis]